MRLTVVGSSGSMSGPDSAASCYLIQARGLDEETGQERTWSVVMDLGPGSFGQLWRHVDPADVDALLITHGHADHMADIISYYVYLKWHPKGHLPSLPTAGPQEIIERVHQIDGYATPDDVAGCFDFTALQPGSTLKVGPMTITAFPGKHPVETYGFRVEGPSEFDGRESVVFAYTGDTDACDAMAQMSQDVDLLLSECGFTDEVEVEGIHLSGSRAGQLAAQGNAGRLVLTHIQPWTDAAVPVAEAQSQYSGPVDIALARATWEL